ncbi:CgeB family protein [Paenibacillus nasutitermitis]|uniref:Spore maturation protein n=1 Tax=Paenibacillus nasutitermitis TaxID=1652958 RepID=A0A916YKE4_9BACL|nr:glycosyltransferase [Paenibacillus nasutitermitis]GGD49906.1 spore maturation protein [Paenibacillus nasutitermitis]
MHTKKATKSRFNAAGYSAGYVQGLRDGACEALAGHVSPPSAVKHDVRVLYIPQGFESIDQGIIEALGSTVRELYVADPARMAEQASLLRPDWMFVLNGMHVFPEDHLVQVDAVRALGIRTMIWFADDPYVTEDTVAIAPRYDVVLTHELSTIEVYRQLGCANVHYMPLAVHTGWFKPQRIEDKYRSDICFIGQAFWNRVETFDAISSYLKGKRVFIAGGMWDRLKNFDRLKSAIRMGWLPVDESIRYYNGARIVINLHRTTASGTDNKNTLNLPGRSINPRTYEIAACGTLQLTDLREDLPNFYKPGSEIETFTGPDELRVKLDYYLTHEEERRTIALRGLRRTLKDHSFISRIQQLADTLQW